MADTYVGDQIEIESSTDTVEQVQTAMGSSIEIEESPAEETETEKKSPVKPSKQPETETEEAPADETETTEEESEETTEEAAEEKAETEEGKPKKKAPPTHVPLKRLNEEIRKRKALERQLEAKYDEPEEKANPAAEIKPQTYCGRPKPNIDQFTSDPTKYSDPYAAHADAVGEWYADERDAKREFEGRQAAIAKAHEERTANFRAAVPKTLERRPDYHHVMKAEAANVSIHENMEEYIYESEIGPDLLLYFVENPDEAARISAMRRKSQSLAMVELEKMIANEIGESVEDETETPKPTPPPKKKLISKTPPPPNRLKPAGPGPKTLQELAGPVDRTGIDIDFNPEYERQAKIRHKT